MFIQPSHIVNNDIIRNHNLRKNKYENSKVNMGCTGNTETKVKFNLNDANAYKKIAITSKDFNQINNKSLPFKGNSEYTDKFKHETSFWSVPKKNNGVLTMNPSSDLKSAARGRPNVQPDEKYLTHVSETKISHQWPQFERREFDWLKLRN